MNTRRQLTLGLFFAGVAAVLGYFTLFMADVKLVGNPQTHVAYFSETNGLRKGSPVLVAGMRWGKVTDMVFDPSAEFDERIEVTFVLDNPVVFKEDVVVTIKDATLLGGKELDIEPGSAEAGPWPEDQRLFGKVQGNVIQELEAFVADNRDGVSRAISNLESITAELAGTQGTIGRLINDATMGEQVSKIITDFEAVSADIRVVSQQLAAGEGTLGKLFMDDALFTQIQTLAADLTAFSADARETLALARDPEAGGLGRLLADPEVSTRVDSIVKNIDEVTAALNGTDGTLGKLINDGALGEELQRAVAGISEFAEGLSGGGLLTTLTSDPGVDAQFREIVTNFQTMSRGLISPNSTVGRLLTDDELYEELSTALTTLQGSLEEAREAAPISAFLNTLFLGF